MPKRRVFQGRRVLDAGCAPVPDRVRHQDEASHAPLDIDDLCTSPWVGMHYRHEFLLHYRHELLEQNQKDQ